MLVDQDLLFGLVDGGREAVADLLAVLEVGQAHNGVAKGFILFGLQLVNVFLQGVRVYFADDQEIDPGGVIAGELAREYCQVYVPDGSQINLGAGFVGIRARSGRGLLSGLLEAAAKNLLQWFVIFELLVNLIIQFIVGIVGRDDADTKQVAEFAADGIYLLVDLTGDLADKIRAVWVAIKQLQ